MVTEEMLVQAAREAETALAEEADNAQEEPHLFSEAFTKKLARLAQKVRNPVRYYAKRILPVVAAVLAIAICVSLLQPVKYKRISFDKETLGEAISHIDENTVVVNNAKETFPTQLPIYEIIPHNITRQEVDGIIDALALPGNASILEFEESIFHYNLVSYTDRSRGYYNMTDAELEKAAWKVLQKIPFLEGEFEYLGKKGVMTITDSEGKHITRAAARFRRCIEGVRITGNDEILIYFDGSGLVEIQIKWFDYKQIGTMDLVPLADAEARIKTPDDFNLEATTGKVQTLQVDQANLLFVNQYNSGCEILQPIYVFSGTAQMQDGTESEFSSKVIAIPEKYTYEVE